MYRFHPVDSFDIQEQLRTGHPTPPRNPMKTIGTILLALVLLAFVLAFAGCATTETTVTAPDGTVTVIKSTAPVPGSIEAIAATAQQFAPKARVVREEKADHDMQRLLRGRPITRQEIALRWKPSLP